MVEPPSAAKLLELGQSMLEAEEQMDPVILFNGAPGDAGGIMPCIGVHPVQGLAVLKAAADAGQFANAGQFNRPDWVALLTDSYHIHGEKNDVDLATTYSGSLGDLFKAGDPRVGEALVVHCVSRLGTVFYAQRPYTRVGDQFIWEDVQDYSTEMESLGGVVVEAMREVIGLPPADEDKSPDLRLS